MLSVNLKKSLPLHSWQHREGSWVQGQPFTCSSWPSFKTAALVSQRQDIEDSAKLVVLKESSPDRLGKGPLEALTHANCIAIPLPEDGEASVDRALGL